MTGLYILDDDNNPVPTDDVVEWGKFFKTNNRQLAEDFVRNSRISTVFLGLDHSHSDNGPPILYETMIFGGKFDGEQWRYRTRAEALDGHVAAVRLVLMKDRE